MGWLYRCAAELPYREPRSMPPNTVRTSSQHSTPAHLIWLFFFTVPLAAEVVLNGGRARASGPRPSGALVWYTVVCRMVMDRDRPCKIVLLTLVVLSMGVTEVQSSRTTNAKQARTAYHKNGTTEYLPLHQARPIYHVPCEVRNNHSIGRTHT